MKTLKLLASFSVLTCALHAQSTGPFVTAGAGIASMTVLDFTVYNPETSTVSEPLQATKRKSNVKFARLNVGYNFTENWALQIGYTVYGTGEVALAFPQYPDIDWAQVVGSGPDVYARHVVRYKTTTISFMPTYTKAVADDARVIVGLGVASSKTDSHFETTYKSGAVTNPAPSYTSKTYAEESNRHLGFVAMLGYDRLVYKTISLGIVGNCTAMKMKVPSAPWTKRSVETVNVLSVGAEVYVGWHW